MKKIQFLATVLLAGFISIGLTYIDAAAHTNTVSNNYRDDYRYNYRDSERIALINGYQLGYGSGSNDYSFSKSFDIRRHKAFRDGDSGYRDQFGDKDRYEDTFRQGFEQGYRDGYSGRRRRTFEGFDGVDYRNDRDYRDRDYRNYRNNRNNRNRDRCDSRGRVIYLP
jgi:hypothetical protein